MNIEASFISKLIKTGDMKTVVESHVSPELFSGTHKNIYKYIVDYHLEFGVVPDVAVINRYYPDFNLVKSSKRRPLKWFIKELRRKATHNSIAGSIEKCYGFLDGNETEKAREELNRVINEINSHIVVSHDIELTASAQDMKDEFERLEKLGGMIGIPSMIKELDNCLKGFQKEQLITIIARLGVGKTWFLVLLLVNIYKQGYDVALGTTEMSAEMMRRRVVAMLFKIPYVQLRGGKMLFKDKQAYFKALDKLSRRENKFYIFRINGGVSFVRTKLDQFKPDILGIDGMYLMDDDEGAKDDTWKVVHITRGLHNLCADLKIPIIGTTQANRQTSKKTGPEVDNISYSDSVGQDSDVVLSLNQTDEMRNDKEMESRVLKQREGQRLRLRMSWDFTSMNFDSLYSENEGDEDEKEDQKQKPNETKGSVKSLKQIATGADTRAKSKKTNKSASIKKALKKVA